jgi:hypothetical protein
MSLLLLTGAAVGLLATFECLRWRWSTHISPADARHASAFSDSYEVSRDRFLKAAANVPSSVHTAYALGPEHAGLYVDMVVVPGDPERVVRHSNDKYCYDRKDKLNRSCTSAGPTASRAIAVAQSNLQH